MLWSSEQTYTLEPFEREQDLEDSIEDVKHALFGYKRVYVETKKVIGVRGRVRNIPDAYLIDLTSKKVPALYVVENELAAHDPLKHIAVQILEFSLSFQTTPQRVKGIVKSALSKDPADWKLCEEYARTNGFENVDYLLKRIIYGRDAFRALVIIDEIPDELETILASRFRFPVEVITLRRFRSLSGRRLYHFEPFLEDVTETEEEAAAAGRSEPIDPSEIDTIVVPARDDGFQETFIGENCWYKIRIHSSMIPRIRYIAAYRTAPISAITHVATVRHVEPYQDTNKYILHFAEPTEPIKPVKLV